MGKEEADAGKEKQYGLFGQCHGGVPAHVAERFCPQCGEAVARNPTGRPRKFCSAACRRKWWAEHPKPEHWKAAQIKTCPVCGKEFLSAKETYRPRTYCSRACANRGRTLKDGAADD